MQSTHSSDDDLASVATRIQKARVGSRLWVSLNETMLSGKSIVIHLFNGFV